MGTLSELKVKPWLGGGAAHESAVEDDVRYSPKVRKIGLGIFLAVVSSLVLILVNAYLIRMGLDDWKAHPTPPLLWVNTALLIVSSLAFQWTVVVARKPAPTQMRAALIVSGVFACAFIVGQLLVWRQLIDLGYYVASNPANSFFYLLTTIHGIHLLGGLVVWANTTIKFVGGKKISEVYTSIELCAIYWHFLLIVWLVFFALMLLN